MDTDYVTFPQLLKKNYERCGDQSIALRKKRYGLWNEYTWGDYYEKVRYFSLGLIGLGLERGDKVAIIGDNDPEWWIGELATQAAGGVALGLYIDCLPSELQYIVDHSDSKFVLAKDQEQCDKLLEIKGQIPKVQKVIYWDSKGMWAYDDPFLMGFEDVLEGGKQFEQDHHGFFEENLAKGKAEDIAVICYTSGTTGLPKAAMLSYKTLLAWTESLWQVHPWYEKDEYLSFLCPAWATDQMIGFAAALMKGVIVNFPEEPETVRENLREISPQCLFSGARLWEELSREVQSKITDTTLLRRFLYNLFLRVGYKTADYRYENKKPPLPWKIIYLLGNGLVFRPLRDRLGLKKTRLCMVAGTMLSPELFRFYQAIGVPLFTYYGATELGSISMEYNGSMRLGSAGKRLPGREMKLSDEGEILVKVDKYMFSGYYKDSEATEKALGRGWYYTGDAGYLDADGYFYFLERMSELMELAKGLKFAPGYIESKLRFSAFIKDAMVVGAGRDFVCAMINIDLQNVGRWAERRHISYTTFVDLSQKPEVCDLVQRDIERVNRTLPEHSRIKKFVNMHKEFDPDEAELTRTRKIRRGFVEKRYQDIIEAIYQGKEKVSVEAEVQYRDGRKGMLVTDLHIRSLES